MLEAVAQRRTLADGYLANDRLRAALKGSVWFYGFQAFVVTLSFAYTAISAPPSGSEVGALILGFQATVAVAVILWTLALSVFYGVLILLLSHSSAKSSPTGSLLVSLFSLLIHTLALLSSVAIIVALVYGSATGGHGGVTLKPIELNGYTAIAIGAVIDLAILLVLLFSTVGRSYTAFAASLRRVPGRYEYSYGTTVMSSTQRPSELSFMVGALHSSAGYSEDDAEEVVGDIDRYLVRFLHRNGKVVAASLQDSSSKRLMAIFPGRESRKLNTEILLEDSYLIQKDLGLEARGTLAKDALISELAEASGWTVSTDGESLISLRRQ